MAIDKPLHNTIHAKMRDIPVPRQVSAERALKQLELLEFYHAIGPEDDILKRLEILASLFDCSNQPTADAFRKQIIVVCEHILGPP